MFILHFVENTYNSIDCLVTSYFKLLMVCSANCFGGRTTVKCRDENSVQWLSGTVLDLQAGGTRIEWQLLKITSVKDILSKMAVKVSKF